MKIKDDKLQAKAERARKKPHSGSRMKRRIVILSIVLIVLAAGALFANRWVKTKGYTGLGDFISTVVSNYYHSFSASPEKVSIRIEQQDYQQLEARRQIALERGMIINEEGSYVPAVLTYKEKEIKIKLRLKGHMTDHIESDKWSFRVRVKGKENFMGMGLFSLQHPGTRGYAYEWIYHEMMKREDIIALRYTFVSVELNGKDLGIYAVEENFDEELIENNQRKKGPVMRFDPDLYWVDRYNGLIRDRVMLEPATFQSANLQPYREEKVIADSSMRESYLRALGLMEGFRRGRLHAHEVFDINRVAKFHAIIDLVGGHHSLDWSDIKYYYNPVTDRLEPVAYESFTILPSRQISGMYRFAKLEKDDFRDDFHVALFSDEKYFREYIKAVERISKPEFLDSFFSEVDAQLDQNLAILYKEFPYKKFDRKLYYRNQQSLRRMLDTPKGFHAYYHGSSGKEIKLKLGAIEALPVEITGLSIGAKAISERKSIVLPSKQKADYVDYIDASFELLPGITITDSMLSSLTVDYSILGASQKKKVKVFPHPYVIRDSVTADFAHSESTINNFPFLSVSDSIITIRPGKWPIASSLVIPSGYSVIAGKGVSLDIKKGGSVLSYSPFRFEGTEEQPITITSSDSSGQGIVLIGTGGTSLFRFVSVTSLSAVSTSSWRMTGALSFYEAPVTLESCSFRAMRSEDAVNIIRSPFTARKLYFTNTKDDALDIDFSNGKIESCVFESCAENAIDISMSQITITGLTIKDVKGKALNIKSGAKVNGSKIKITGASIGISAEDLSDVTISTLTLTDCELGIAAYKNKPASGPASVTVSGISIVNVARPYAGEIGSAIVIDGKPVESNIKDVEQIVRDTDSKP